MLSIDGIDLRDINLAHLRRNLGVVLQENFLFRGTISENILAGPPGLTLSNAVHAARLAGAAEFIERLPNGYATMIEEGSPNLSGGQRQRLAIARALVHDPRILILDEATSALDPESEALVNANLAQMAHGRTMVIVSHRLSSLTDCDAILVLDQGRVLDLGTAQRTAGPLPRLPAALASAEPPPHHRRRRRRITQPGAQAMSVTLPTSPALLEFQSPTEAVIAARIPLSGRTTSTEGLGI